MEETEARDYLDDVTAMSVYEIARMTGCASPDSRDSAGAVLLAGLRDDMVTAWREGRYAWFRDHDDNDRTHEIAEATFPLYDTDIWQAFADLGIGFENEHTQGGEWSGSLSGIASDVLGQILDQAAHQIMSEIRRCQATWECQVCGDTGRPLVCSPDECNGSDEDREAWAERLLPEYDSDGFNARAEAVSPPPSPALHAELSEVDAYLRRAAMVNEEEFARLTHPFGWRVAAFMGLGALVFLIIAIAVWVIN